MWYGDPRQVTLRFRTAIASSALGGALIMFGVLMLIASPGASYAAATANGDCQSPAEPTGTAIHVTSGQYNATIATSWSDTSYVCEFGTWQQVHPVN